MDPNPGTDRSDFFGLLEGRPAANVPGNREGPGSTVLTGAMARLRY